MLPEIKQKLDNLKVCGWDEVVIKHDDDDEGVCFGIHTVYGYNRDDNGNVVSKISWDSEPILVADSLQEMKAQLEKMLWLVDKQLVTTREELTEYNGQPA